MTRREVAWLVVGSLAFALVFSYPMLCDWVYLGPGVRGWIGTGPVWNHLRRLPANGDSDLFEHITWVGWYTVTYFHQLPFWNPYKCGGMPELGNPETSVVTPFFLAYLVGGFSTGFYINTILHLAIAVAGCCVLGRVLGLGVIASAVAAAVFPSSSWYYLHLGMGHLNFLPAAYLPWIAALLIVAFERTSYLAAALGGLLTALTFNEGNYTLLYAMVLVGSLAITYSLLRLSIRPLVMAAVIGIFTFCFAATKFLPASQALTLRPREVFGSEWDTVRMMMGFVFSRDQDLYREGASVFMYCEYGEYGAYVAWAFVPLAIVGICLRPARSLPWVVTGVLFVWLAGGAMQPYAALRVLQMLPLGGNIAFPSRFLITFTLCFGVVAGFGAQSLCSRPEKWGVAVTGLLLAAGLIDAWTVGPPNLRYMFHNAIAPAESAWSEEFRQSRVINPASNATATAWNNLGVVNCYGYWYPPPPGSVRAYTDKDYRGEYYLLGEGKVTAALWTPNRLAYDVDAPAPTSLVVNQFYFPGWKLARGGGKVYSEDSTLAVRIGPGRQRIELVYAPQHILLAFALTMAAVAALILIWRKEAQN
jgi:hypothetical protein